MSWWKTAKDWYDHFPELELQRRIFTVEQRSKKAAYSIAKHLANVLDSKFYEILQLLIKIIMIHLSEVLLLTVVICESGALDLNEIHSFLISRVMIVQMLPKIVKNSFNTFSITKNITTPYLKAISQCG